jgi:hypothetical protein
LEHIGISRRDKLVETKKQQFLDVLDEDAAATRKLNFLGLRPLPAVRRQGESAAETRATG